MYLFFFCFNRFLTDMLYYVMWYQASGKTMDHVDLLREQLKILSGEVAFNTSSLKRLTEEAGRSPMSEKIQVLSVLANVYVE